MSLLQWSDSAALKPCSNTIDLQNHLVVVYWELIAIAIAIASAVAGKELLRWQKGFNSGKEGIANFVRKADPVEGCWRNLCLQTFTSTSLLLAPTRWVQYKLFSHCSSFFYPISMLIHQANIKISFEKIWNTKNCTQGSCSNLSSSNFNHLT